MKRLMSIDIGEKRVGVALSDPLRITAQPHCVLENDGPEGVSRKIKNITDEYPVEKIIAGMPYGLKGEKGRAAEKILAFIRVLEDNTGIRIETLDERFTTALSRRVMLEADASRETRRKKIDKVAAAILLQCYLDGNGGKDAAGQADRNM